MQAPDLQTTLPDLSQSGDGLGIVSSLQITNVIRKALPFRATVHKAFVSGAAHVFSVASPAEPVDRPLDKPAQGPTNPQENRAEADAAVLAPRAPEKEAQLQGVVLIVF